MELEGCTSEVKLAGARYVAEVGLSGRIVYNSITPDTTEIAVIRESKILTLTSKMPTIAGRLEVVDKLLEKMKKAGIENILIDAAVLDIPYPGPTGGLFTWSKRDMVY